MELGLYLEYLKDLSEEALHYANEAIGRFERIRDEERDARDNAAAIAGECVRAVESLTSLQMESIRMERYPSDDVRRVVFQVRRS